MISVYLEGHDFSYEVYELLRMFYANEEIEFIESIEEYKDNGTLIESFLKKTDDDYFCIAKVIENGVCISEHKISSIKSIDIKKDSIKKKIKNGIKKCIYEAVSPISTIEVPWGILTGVRPLKIVHDLMDKGFDEDAILKVLCDEYKLFPEKAKLIIQIGKKQRNYIYPLDNDRFSLYVSIPFCPTRCVYCSFPSNSVHDAGKYIDEYTEKIIDEIYQVGELMKDKKIHTVYVGGGTPTAIPKENLDKIIKSIYRTFGKDNIKEITVEAGRPDTINKEMLSMLKENGVNRISINPQTMNLETLKIIGRKHTPEDIINAYSIAKEVGFETINMDIIAGLPSEGIAEIKNTLEQISKLNPENLTVHTLAIKRASKFKERIEEFSTPKQTVLNSMLNLAREYSSMMDLEPYYLYRQKHMLGNFENIGYAKKGKECIYNILIMEEKETIMAVGAGAISKIFYPRENRLERVPNVKNLMDYLNRTAEMVERKKKYIDTI